MVLQELGDKLTGALRKLQYTTVRTHTVGYLIRLPC